MTLTLRTRRRLRRAIRPIIMVSYGLAMIFLIPFLALPSLWGDTPERIDL